MAISHGWVYYLRSRSKDKVFNVIAPNHPLNSIFGENINHKATLIAAAQNPVHPPPVDETARP